MTTRNYYWTFLDPLSFRQVVNTSRETEIGPSCFKKIRKQNKISILWINLTMHLKICLDLLREEFNLLIYRIKRLASICGYWCKAVKKHPPVIQFPLTIAYWENSELFMNPALPNLNNYPLFWDCVPSCLKQGW